MIYEQYGNDTVIFSNMAAAAENKSGSRLVNSLNGFTYVYQEKNLEKISKAWNGSGPMTELYWLRIKEYL